MSWQRYQLVYKALSPVHIGYHTLGMIDRTRYYIPGRPLWGALTADLTRRAMRAAQIDYRPELYEGVGSFVRENAILGYFYLAQDPGEPFFPCFTGAGLHYGPLPLREFESRFVRSLTSTATEGDTWTAADGSLHEIEYLIPQTPDGEVYFVGNLYLRQRPDPGQVPSVLRNLPELTEAVLGALGEMCTGGERKYGFGRLRLVDLSTPSVVDSPHLVLKAGDSLPAHLAGEELDVEVWGEVEPLVGREWDSTSTDREGAGQRVSSALVCWIPGSVVQEWLEVRVGAFGVLHQVDGGGT